MGLKGIIKSAPYPVEQAARRLYDIIPAPMRFGRLYRATVRFLEDSQRWDIARHHEYQQKRLAELLSHAYQNVPYYHRAFDDAGFCPRQFHEIDDLRRLPLLSRDDVRNNMNDLIARNFPHAKLQFETTSGSSGNPLGFCYERGVSDQIERAFIHTLWKRAGFVPGDRCAVFRGRVLKTSVPGQLWEYDPVGRQLYFSAYNLADENLAAYVEELRKFAPRFICGFPSAVLLLGQFMLREKAAPFQKLRAVFCGSENLFPGVRRILRKAFGCRIFSWYGHSERAALAGECEHDERYHVFPEYGVVELIRPDGTVIENPSETGEIVATALHNRIFPLIRYRTGDLASYSGIPCACGRFYRLLARVDGRAQDFIVTSDSRTIILTAFAAPYHLAAFARIRQIQYVQDRPGEVKIRIVRLPEFSSADEDEMRLAFSDAVQGRLDIAFEYVDDIPRAASGKHKLLIQRLSANRESIHV
jgi:phenylacetate-CoA ligase